MTLDTSGRRRARTVKMTAAWLTVVLAGSLSAQSTLEPTSDAQPGQGPAQPAGLRVDVTAGAGSDGNDVLEPGESVIVAPSWKNAGAEDIQLSGVAADPGFTGPAGGIYAVTDGSAGYGIFAPGAIASCLDTGDCYQLSVTPTPPRPLHWDAIFTEIAGGAGSVVTKAWTVHLGDSFTDVPRSHPYYRYVETLLHGGGIGACAPDLFCPDELTTRAQMAVIVLASAHGSGWAPPPCRAGREVFTDVPAASPFCPWIEELARRGSVPTCAAGAHQFCPGKPARRGEMAYAVVATREVPGYNPPACTHDMQSYSDVEASDPLCPWIEALAPDLELTGPPGGDPTCNPDHFCPQELVPRRVASFLAVAGFGLRLYE